MKNRLRAIVTAFLLILLVGCASLSVNPKTELKEGQGSTWDSDDYRSPDWVDMYGH